MKRVLVISLAVVLTLSLSMVALPANKAMAAGDWYVNPGDSIQNAINAAEAAGGGTVHVAAGTYNENILLKDGVEVVGDGPGDTIISSTSIYPVVTATGKTDAKLDGFTITNGSGSGTQLGAGVSIQAGSSNVTISNCVITGNTADLRGGGIAVADSSATIVNCTIAGNTAKRIGTFGGSGGGIYNNGTLTVNNCTIYDNTAEIAGGGVRNDEGTLTVNNTIIYDNTAYFKGGGLNNIGGTVTLKNSTISKNTSTGTWLPQSTALSGGGGISTDGPVTLINSIVNGNTATAGGDTTAEGGGIRVGGSNGELNIINSTIVNNTAKTSGGAIRGGPTTVTNSILWGNSSPQFEGTPTISYSLVEGGYTDIGNISGDPQFVDADGADDIVGTLDDDLHLQATSPCIDAGDNSTPNLPDTDKDGNDRIINGTVDMGAYEAPAIDTITEVEIDIKPGSDPNSINPDSKGVIPVAILTTADFDAASVNATTVRFGPGDAEPVHYALENVDDDDVTDMILHFKTQKTGITAGDTKATLTGKTTDGKDIVGTDSVETVPPKGKVKKGSNSNSGQGNGQGNGNGNSNSGQGNGQGNGNDNSNTGQGNGQGNGNNNSNPGQGNGKGRDK